MDRVFSCRTLWPAAALAVGSAALLAACTFAGTPEAETPAAPVGTSTPSPAAKSQDPLPWEEDPALLFSIRQVSWWPGGWLDDDERRYTFILAQPEGQEDVWQVIGWQDETGTLYPAEGNPPQADPLQAAMDYAAAYLEGSRDEEAFYLQGTWTASEEQSIPHTDDITIETASMADNAVTILLTANRPGEWTYGLPFTLEREIGGTWYHVPPVCGNYEFPLAACLLPTGVPTEMDYGLEWIYGTLPPGHYRLLPDVGCENAEGTDTDYLLAAEFDIP